MSQQTHIQWTQRTWNPIAGCSKVSAGCDGCYAIRDTRRLSCNPHPKVRAAYADLVQITNGRWNWTGTVRLVEEKLTLPLEWRKPSRIFVNSMSDLFHESVPDEWIDRVFAVMNGAPQHIFQILTKRPARMRAYLSDPEVACRWGWHKPVNWTEAVIRNVWVGVSAEDQATADARIPELLRTPAAVRWVSLEPLIGPITLAGSCRGYFRQEPPTFSQREVYKGLLDWVVVGGESGKAARPMHPAWVTALRDQCQAAGVPFFFKQWGEWLPCGQIPTLPLPDRLYRGFRFDGDYQRVLRVGRKLAGRRLYGREWNEYPHEKGGA